MLRVQEVLALCGEQVGKLLMRWLTELSINEDPTPDIEIKAFLLYQAIAIYMSKVPNNSNLMLKILKHICLIL